jgi:transcriptional regulator with XRE-family HTH domain
MAKTRGTGDPRVTRLLVLFLRNYAHMTQDDLEAASGVYQSAISFYENGDKVPDERTLRRLAAAVGLDWQVVVHLRRAMEAAVHAADARALTAGPADQDLASDLSDYTLLSVVPDLIQIATQGTPELTREQTEREAEEIWQNLAPYAPKQRRKLIEVGVRAERNWKLAVLACQASVEAANKQDATDLAELALAIAERAPGSEEWKSRLQGHCLAYLARAQKMAHRDEQAEETYGRALRLWQAGADLEPPALKEWPGFGLEAILEARFESGEVDVAARHDEHQP